MVNRPRTLVPDGESSEGSELWALLWLSAPLVASHAGTQLMSFVDTAMVGRLGPVALGAVGIGNGIFFTFTLVAMGCVLGMDPLVAQAVGAGERDRARLLLRRGLRLAALLSVPLVAVLLAAPWALEPIGVDPVTARETRVYLLGRTPNAVPFLLFAALRSYLQAVGTTWSIVVSMIAANVVNLLGNALLIYGDAALVTVGLAPMGLPALGVFGSGLASSIAAVISVGVLALGLRAHPATVLPGVTGEPSSQPHPGSPGAPVSEPAPPGDRASIRAMLVVGLPIGLQLFVEMGAFAIAGVLAGTLGATSIAGHQVALTLASFTFTVSLGISSATSVRVGHAVGRGAPAAARRAGFLGLAMAGVFMGASALLFLAAPRSLARILTNDPEVLAVAVPLMLIAAFFQISDGLQVVAAGAVRGCGDTHAALIWNLVGHYAIGLPVAVALGLRFGLGLGAPGIWWGLLAGLTVVAAGLTRRFHQLSSRGVARL